MALAAWIGRAGGSAAWESTAPPARGVGPGGATIHLDRLR